MTLSTDTPVTTYGLYINGEWHKSESGKTMAVINPATGETIAHVAEGSAKEVDAAVTAARNAFPGWAALSPGERAAALFKLADLIEQNSERLADLESRNAGKPVKLSRNSDIPFAVDNLRFFAGAARVLEGRASAEYIQGYQSIIRREPIGVVASISPWNYPFMMAIWKIGPALATGNTVVLKPASITPLTSLELGKLATEAGLPPGVLNIVTGRGEVLGEALVKHPQVDMVSLTGDTATGKRIMEMASGSLKKVHLELGGKAAFVVYEDADLEAAARGAAVAGYVNSGQDCTAGTRVYVHESIYSKFLEKFKAVTAEVRLGNPMEMTTDLGPMVSAAQRDKVEGLVKKAIDQGAKLAAGGERPKGDVYANGFFVSPTILEVDHASEIVQTEVFGPVVAVLKFSSQEEVIQKANDVPYGLASSVWTRDIYKALNTANALKFGTVWINDHLPIASEMPHGGFKQSGFGKDMSSYAIEDYTQIKHVLAELTGTPRKGWHFTILGDAE